MDASRECQWTGGASHLRYPLKKYARICLVCWGMDTPGSIGQQILNNFTGTAALGFFLKRAALGAGA